MNKLLKVLVLSLVVSLTACGDEKLSDGKTYPSYGLFNADTNKLSNVCYEPSLASVIWGVVLIEMIIPTVYIVGWDFMSPVRLKTSPTDECKVIPK